MDPFSIAGAGIGLIGGIANMFGNRKANRRLDALMKSNPQYQANPLARQQMGLAQTLLNARMPGAASAERNIYQTQANNMANVNRNATDASQALALGAASQGQSNQAFGNLATQEAQDYQRRYGNLASAQQGVINEDDKVFQDKVRQFQDRAQIMGAQNANRQNTWSSFGNLGFGLMNFGLAGGMQNMFGKNGAQSGVPSSGNYPYDPKYNYENTLPARKLNMQLQNPYPNNQYGEI